MTDNHWRAMFGFLLLLLISVLAAIIALGKVEENSSYGLQILLGCITTLSGGFATWAFGQQPRRPEQDSQKDPN